MIMLNAIPAHSIYSWKQDAREFNEDKKSLSTRLFQTAGGDERRHRFHTEC
jgi:hypothetical protein